MPALKQNLRFELLARRQALAEDAKSIASRQAIDLLRQYLTSRPVNHLLCYRAVADEVDTRPLFELPAAPIYAPRMLPDRHMEWVEANRQTRWIRGPFGIEEPNEGYCWDGEPHTVLICPLTGFDRRGNRLGMGMGFFDRWLARHSDRISEIIGLAFGCQEVADIPAEPHDIPLDTVITEQEVIACRNR